MQENSNEHAFANSQASSMSQAESGTSIWLWWGRQKNKETRWRMGHNDQ